MSADLASMSDARLAYERQKRDREVNRWVNRLAEQYPAFGRAIDAALDADAEFERRAGE